MDDIEHLEADEGMRRLYRKLIRKGKDWDPRIRRPSCYGFRTASTLPLSIIDSVYSLNLLSCINSY